MGIEEARKLSIDDMCVIYEAEGFCFVVEDGEVARVERE